MTELDAVAGIEASIDKLIEVRDQINELPRGSEYKAALTRYTGLRFKIFADLTALVRECDLQRPVIEAAMSYKTKPYGLTILLARIEAYVAATAPPNGEQTER